MKIRTGFMILFLFLGSTVSAQIAPTLKYKNLSPTIYYRDSLQLLRQYEASLATCLKECYPRKEAECLYRIAVNYAKMHQTDSSFRYLNEFIHYSNDDRMILTDKAFEPLRVDSLKWRQLVSLIEKSYLASSPDEINNEFALKLFYLSIDIYASHVVQYTTIRDASDSKYEIIAMEKARNVNSASTSNYYGVSLSIDNMQTFKEIVNQYGFPTRQKAGLYGETFALKMLRDLVISDKEYENIVTRYNSGDYDKLAYAYFTDLRLKWHNKKQIYGTQYIYTRSKKVRRYWQKTLYKIADFEQVNDRRKEMGFTETIEQYAINHKIDIPEKYYKRTKHIKVTPNN